MEILSAVIMATVIVVAVGLIGFLTCLTIKRQLNDITDEVESGRWEKNNERE